mmetsp:Transcript_24812/g.86389  ORF Transcript_24812/g.86389 Transcript_24812/m.86389 type:complete len:259 (+) Transcript_24812:298-1074(+)
MGPWCGYNARTVIGIMYVNVASVIENVWPFCVTSTGTSPFGNTTPRVVSSMCMRPDVTAMSSNSSMGTLPTSAANVMSNSWWPSTVTGPLSATSTSPSTRRLLNASCTAAASSSTLIAPVVRLTQSGSTLQSRSDMVSVYSPASGVCVPGDSTVTTKLCAPANATLISISIGGTSPITLGYKIAQLYTPPPSGPSTSTCTPPPAAGISLMARAIASAFDSIVTVDVDICVPILSWNSGVKPWMMGVMATFWISLDSTD